jgi:methylated-DNA-[protein]-cysteine S-methyltransferase
MLREIPYGRTTSYGTLAKQYEALNKGKRGSPRAIGGAVGHNPISILIPCHRVVGAGGGLTGYAGGIEKKIQLLQLEGVVLRRQVEPPGRRGTSFAARPDTGANM